MKKVAVIGSGISGLSCAWALSQSGFELDLFEANDYFGGHAHTVTINIAGQSLLVDTGFLVHNPNTYPNFLQFLSQLCIDTYETKMSFSVVNQQENMVWAGSNLKGLFCQSRNLFNGKFLRMLWQVLRFNHRAPSYLAQVCNSGLTLGELLRSKKYAPEIAKWYLYPMGASIWSSSEKNMDTFPAETFLQFALNHSLLQVFNRPKWHTIRGGAKSYVDKVLATLKHTHLNCEVLAVKRREDGLVDVIFRQNGIEQQLSFDHVVLATHGDTSLQLLQQANEQERSILSRIRYEYSTAVLHLDQQLMPPARTAWSAWNYRATDSEACVQVTYWLNRLQHLPCSVPILLTLAPQQPPANEIARYHYAHPIINQQTVLAQQELASIQGKDRIWFAGAWTGYGFHEDGLKSGLWVAQKLGATLPWQPIDFPSHFT